mgnify:FL=1|tara:strand:- start:1087 stop:1521 length:435 start_codon:yes stop_codon:yes gene_type:complete
MILKLLISSLAILITLYGVFKKNRVFFNFGYFAFGIMIVIDQLKLYSELGQYINLALASLWLIQTIIALPNKLPYDGSKLAKSAAVKIYLCLSLVNAFGAFYATKVDYIPNGAMYGHTLLAILPLVAMYLVLNNKIEITTESNN